MAALLACFDENAAAIGLCMPHTAPADLHCPIGTLAHLPEVLREAGYDPWELLEPYGVTPRLLEQPTTPFPLASVGQIMQAAGDLPGCERVGLQIGQRATLDNAGPLRLLVFNARTTREAVESLVRFSRLWYRGLQFTLVREGGVASITVALDPSVPGHRQLLMASLAALLKHLEGVFGHDWRPSQILRSGVRPQDAEHYARYFRAPVLYRQPVDAILFPLTDLQKRRPGGDAKLESFMREYLGELEARTGTDFPARVRAVIENLLAAGDCSIERVAAIFAVHRHTLYRRLREHDTSFEAILDETRSHLATRMLAETPLAVGEVATALGYGSAGSFVRAFVRWHGSPPGAWRELRRKGSGSARKRARARA